VDVVLSNGVINFSLERFRLFEETGFTRVRSAVVPRFRFRKESTQNSAEAYGVKAGMMTALKPAAA